MDKPPSPFVGSFGPDWNVRQAQLGPPDNINHTQMQWLIVPGPPMSCYLAFVFPRADPTPMTFFHAHPSTWSIHVVLGGQGVHHVQGTSNPVSEGSVIYQGPGVAHSLHPLPNQPLVHLAIQHPAAGYVKEQWKICDSAGVVESPGDLSAFAARFGSVDQLLQSMKAEQVWSSDRWMAFVGARKLPNDVSG